MSGYCYNEACTKDFFDLEKDIVFAGLAGFNLIELRFDCLKKYLEKHTIVELKDLLKFSKLKPSALNALYIYPEFLTPKADKSRDREIFELLDLIENLYQKAGISECIVVAPLLENDTLCSSYNKLQIKEDCIRILRYLSTTKPYIKWIFEPVGLSRSLVRNADFAYEIISEIDCLNVGLVLDSYNLYLTERSDSYFFDNLDVNRVFAIHMMNGKLVPQEEKIIDQRHRVFCQDGDAINLSNFLDALKNLNYHGMISTEVFNLDYPSKFTQQEIISRAFNQLSGVLNEYNKMCGYRFF